jgi:hypothetical protein
MSNAHAFVLGILASWTPSALLFVLLVRRAGTRADVWEDDEALDEPERRGRNRPTQTGTPREEENVCLPFQRRDRSGRSVSGRRSD